MALGTTTIENIVAHDAAALEKDLAGIRLDSQVTLPGVPQIVTRLQQMLSDPDVGISQLIPVINYEPILVGRVLQMANSAALNPTRKQVTDVVRASACGLRPVALGDAGLRHAPAVAGALGERHPPHLEALWEAAPGPRPCRLSSPASSPPQP